LFNGVRMPKLIRLYIVSVAIGFAIALVFVAALLAMDTAGLRHLILETEKGWLAGVMMVFFNGVVFASVQFAIRVMGLAEDGEGPRGGLRTPLTQLIPLRVVSKPKSRR
jgi:TRAP-type C4-dicarboxylate transport system permease small subunit